MKNKLLSGLLGFFIAILIITFSIGLPIYFRPFYYMQIDYLEIEEYSGADRDTILEAYNELLDYLTVPGNEFGTGDFPYSENGKSHFVDCKVLFDLNAWAFIISLAGFVTLIILNKKGIFELWRPFGMNIAFCSGAYTLGGFAVIGGLVAIDFDKAFTVFHKLFFPGKDNWLFSWYDDAVIRILPEAFFMNCAILIFTSIVALCLGCIAYGIIGKLKKKA
ncbi:MAG: TIGR01906 family membrane protein [Clostridia bacterium]|nr:TIGR01906 family membrane protein [Clostridia bacterium]